MDQLFEFLRDQPLALLAFGAVLAVIFGVRYLGLWQGQHAAPEAKTGEARVAAVIVDPTALNAAAAEVAGLAVAVTSVTVVLREIAVQQKRTADELDNVREEMRIHREVSRR